MKWYGFVHQNPKTTKRFENLGLALTKTMFAKENVGLALTKTRSFANFGLAEKYKNHEEVSNCCLVTEEASYCCLPRGMTCTKL